MQAYDYDQQRWMTGADGERLAQEQIRDTLEVLAGPDAQAYLDFIGERRPLAEIVRDLRKQLTHACQVCGGDIGWDAPSGVCSVACLRKGQSFAP